VCVLLGFLKKTWAIPIMNPLSWFMILLIPFEVYHMLVAMGLCRWGVHIFFSEKLQQSALLNSLSQTSGTNKPSPEANSSWNAQILDVTNTRQYYIFQCALLTSPWLVMRLSTVIDCGAVLLAYNFEQTLKCGEKSWSILGDNWSTRPRLIVHRMVLLNAIIIQYMMNVK